MLAGPVTRCGPEAILTMNTKKAKMKATMIWIQAGEWRITAADTMFHPPPPPPAKAGSAKFALSVTRTCMPLLFVKCACNAGR